MNILVTGGAGYIGSHTCVELLEAGHSLVVLDNLSHSSPLSIMEVISLTGASKDDIKFIQGDVLDYCQLSSIFTIHDFDAVIHFAGLKSVTESNRIPFEYYENNVQGTLNVLRLMQDHDVRNFIFSSSATVYGNPLHTPIQENHPTGRAVNPYGRTKQICEDILLDMGKTSKMNIGILRYFNPIGAHPSGKIGEDPRGIPANLVPYITQVAVGEIDQLLVYGDDYDTPDGTGVRDYIHVVDLAKGHVAMLNLFERNPVCVAVNLGTGQGYSVLEVIRTFEETNGVKIPYQVVGRREGDIATCYCDTTLARNLLGWEAKYSLKAMVYDAWKWQKSHPQGYGQELTVDVE